MPCISNQPFFDFNDITIIPVTTSPISSRKECNPYTINSFLPLYVSPMSSVIDERNANLFEKNKIKPVLPRTVDLKTRLAHTRTNYSAFGLEEIVKLFVNGHVQTETQYILIDIANGHMQRLLDIIRQIKTKHGEQIHIMAGNVANPETYKTLSEAGCDAVRVGIGGGNSCSTSANVAIHYPYGSLIVACRELKEKHNLTTEIIADGGMKWFSDIIKALALGADSVMLGSILNKALESAGTTSVISWDGDDETYKVGSQINQFDPQVAHDFKHGLSLIKEYYGMSTKRAQKEMGKTDLKTSEGIIKTQPVEYTIAQWTENFHDYLVSTMSYCGACTLSEFIGKVNYCQITENAYKRFHK